MTVWEAQEFEDGWVTTVDLGHWPPTNQGKFDDLARIVQAAIDLIPAEFRASATYTLSPYMLNIYYDRPSTYEEIAQAMDARRDRDAGVLVSLRKKWCDDLAQLTEQAKIEAEAK